jgi:hypothetical protein
MGYFPNGTSGDIYEHEFCSKCVHQENKDGRGCAVMMAHMLHNYKECNNEDSILHLLIPRDKDGWNERCLMFHAGDAPTPDAEIRAELVKNMNPAYRDWAQKKGLV